jgi:hypothetical protein
MMEKSVPVNSPDSKASGVEFGLPIANDKKIPDSGWTFWRLTLRFLHCLWSEIG